MYVRAQIVTVFGTFDGGNSDDARAVQISPKWQQMM
jgi:hypothetical protein